MTRSAESDSRAESFDATVFNLAGLLHEAYSKALGQNPMISMLSCVSDGNQGF